MRNNQNYICISKLKRERGWTGKLIERYLIAPDKTEPNPFYPCPYPMKLFKRSRVLEAEESQSFKNDLADVEKNKKKRQKNDGRTDARRSFVLRSGV